MEMPKVTHMKSTPIIPNHMPAHVYQYLILSLCKSFQISRVQVLLTEKVRSNFAAASRKAIAFQIKTLRADFSLCRRLLRFLCGRRVGSNHTHHPTSKTTNTFGSVELVLIIVCACIPTLKPIYDRHLKHRGTQARNPRLIPTMPTMRPVGKSTYEGSTIDEENDDPTSFPSSFPLSRPSNTARGTHRGSYELCASDEAEVKEAYRYV